MRSLVETNVTRAAGLTVAPHPLATRATSELLVDQSDAPDGITPFRPDWVVPLQPEGSERPVFVFPAGHDEVRALAIDARVAAHVGRHHPFWGFRRDDSHFERVRAIGVPAMTEGYVAQMRAIQSAGPYLLFGTCIGGYFAWETARQLLAAGEEVGGVLFYEVPIRSDVATAKRRGLARHYCPDPLPIPLTLLMTEAWRVRGWSVAWKEVVHGSIETVVIPGETETVFERREERIARHVREWIEHAERRASVIPSRN